MSDSTGGTPEPPHTPTWPPRARRHQHDEDTTPVVSSSATPSLDLEALDLSPVSPLPRRSSSPFFEASPPSASSAGAYGDDEADRTLDSRDALVQRLNDLVARLSGDDDLPGAVMDVLHARVDEMEDVMSSEGNSTSRIKSRERASAGSLGEEVRSAGGSLASSLASSAHMFHRLPDISLSGTGIVAEAPERTVHQLVESDQPPSGSHHLVQHVMQEAQALNQALVGVMNSLKARQEEQDHIHELLITRLERAAQRILYLESRLKDMESEQDNVEVEILNLQIQLKAIEVSSLSYAPPKGADPDLEESIETWKASWSALKRQRAMRRGGGDLASVAGVSPSPLARRSSLLRSGTAPG